MLNRDNWAAIWQEFKSDKARAYFASQSILFFDFVDMPEYRDKPEHFGDSAHPDSTAVTDVMRRVLNDNRVRALLPNLERDW
jgi:hypothetical protein